jgi:Lsr2
MAQKVTVTMTDDIDGTKADETVSFRIDGTSYEIDLSKKNAAALRRVFTPYIGHARRAPRGARAGRPARSRQRSSDVRTWAKSQGIQVSERGRIPASVVSQYEEANA